MPGRMSRIREKGKKEKGFSESVENIAENFDEKTQRSFFSDNH